MQSLITAPMHNFNKAAPKALLSRHEGREPQFNRIATAA